MKKDEDKQTLVEEGTEFTGTMRARCKVVVRGSMDGDLEAPALEVTEGGSMTGNVKAERVDSRGVLAGSVEAEEISLAGVVRSDTVIRAKTLSVNLSSEEGRLEVTFGDTVLEVGEMPTDRPAESEDVVGAEASAAGSVQDSPSDDATGLATAESPSPGPEEGNDTDASVEAAEEETDSRGGGGRRRKGRKNRAQQPAEAATEGEGAPAP